MPKKPETKVVVAVAAKKDSKIKEAPIKTKAKEASNKTKETKVKEVKTKEVKTKAPKAKAASKKKEKDPAAPKKNKSSYLFFVTEKRAQVVSDFPELKGKDIVSKLAELWRELSDDEKKPFVDLAAKDKIRYEEDKKNYTSGNKESPEKESEGEDAGEE
jgi:hypothetical protein